MMQTPQIPVLLDTGQTYVSQKGIGRFSQVLAIYSYCWVISSWLIAQGQMLSSLGWVAKGHSRVDVNGVSPVALPCVS